MITPEEREEIINAAVERALLKIPEVVGNLAKHTAMTMKMNRQFYERYPEFKDYKEAVASVVESLDKGYSTEDYSKLLEKAVPLIKERIKTVRSLDVKTSNIPKRTFNLGDL